MRQLLTLSALVSSTALMTGCSLFSFFGSSEDKSPAATSSPKPDKNPSMAGGGSSGGGSPGGHGEGSGGNKAVPVPFVSDTREAMALKENKALKALLQAMAGDNSSFVKRTGMSYFKPFLESQSPRATLVACSDSRVQTTAFHTNPENDLFTIRNIGNQLPTSEGSVEYGVHHLNTPVLMFVGHTGCGAVKAALGDYGKESLAIKKELDTISLPQKKSVPKDGLPNDLFVEAVLSNVHNQVRMAVEKFQGEVAERKLNVLGLVYDFRNDLKQGFGRMVVVNINGYSDAGRVNAFLGGLTSTNPQDMPSGLPNTPPPATDGGHH